MTRELNGSDESLLRSNTEKLALPSGTEPSLSQIQVKHVPSVPICSH